MDLKWRSSSIGMGKCVCISDNIPFYKKGSWYNFELYDDIFVVTDSYDNVFVISILDSKDFGLGFRTLGGIRRDKIEKIGYIVFNHINF